MSLQPPPEALPVEDIDSEIQQLRDDLERTRKLRALMQLRTELAREKQLLFEAQQQLFDVSQTPVVEERIQPAPTIPAIPNGVAIVLDPEPIEEPPRGIKRSYSESESRSMCEFEEDREDRDIQEGEQPATLAVRQLYKGRNRKEYNLLVRYLGEHFERHQNYYTSDERKIAEAERHVEPSIIRSWKLHVSITKQSQTWIDFISYLVAHIRITSDPAKAAQRYYAARQGQSQDVRDFSNMLSNFESNMDYLLTDQERIKRLRDGILPEIREAAALAPQYSDDTYQEQLQKIANAERQIPGRVHVHKFRKAKRRRRV